MTQTLNLTPNAKRDHMRLVFRQIHLHRTLTRPQLAGLTGLSAMTAGRLVDALIDKGLVREAAQADEHLSGRPARRLRVASESLRCLSAALDRDGVQVGVIDPYGQVLAWRALPLNMAALEPGKAVERLAFTLQELRDQAEPGTLLDAVGVSAPGLIDHKGGRVRFSSQLKWRDFSLTDSLQAALGGARVVIDNDIKAWALAEKQFGATRAAANAVLLSLGSGIGAAAVVDGVLHRGKDNMAGEIGHISIHSDARMCECGKLGCLQTNVADWAILQEARSIKPDASLDDVFDGYRDGVHWARLLLDHAVEHACVAVNLLVNTYAPELIVLCGSLVDRYPLFFQLIEKGSREKISGFTGQDFSLVPSCFGGRGALIGAGALAFACTVEQLLS